MSRLTLVALVGVLCSAPLLTAACGGNSFVEGFPSAGSGQAGAGNGPNGGSGTAEAGSASEAGSVTSAGSSAAGSSTAGSSAGVGGSLSVGGAGNSSGVGGSPSGGASGAASAQCATGTISFKLVPAKGTQTGAFCGGCGVDWLTVTNAAGRVIALDPGCGAATCDSCIGSACPAIACLNQPIPPAGLSRDWNETQWQSSTCGAASLSCVAAHCVPAGRYKARMCALKNSTSAGDLCTSGGATSPVCTEVAFDLPGATTVQGTISG